METTGILYTAGEGENAVVVYCHDEDGAFSVYPESGGSLGDAIEYYGDFASAKSAADDMFADLEGTEQEWEMDGYVITKRGTSYTMSITRDDGIDGEDHFIRATTWEAVKEEAQAIYDNWVEYSE